MKRLTFRVIVSDDIKEKQCNKCPFAYKHTHWNDEFSWRCPFNECKAPQFNIEPVERKDCLNYNPERCGEGNDCLKCKHADFVKGYSEVTKR